MSLLVIIAVFAEAKLLLQNSIVPLSFAELVSRKEAVRQVKDTFILKELK